MQAAKLHVSLRCFEEVSAFIEFVNSPHDSIFDFKSVQRFRNSFRNTGLLRVAHAIPHSELHPSVSFLSYNSYLRNAVLFNAHRSSLSYKDQEERRKMKGYELWVNYGELKN